MHKTILIVHLCTQELWRNNSETVVHEPSNDSLRKPTLRGKPGTRELGYSALAAVDCLACHDTDMGGCRGHGKFGSDMK